MGEYTFTLTCDGIAGTPAVANEVVTVSAAAVISSFTATPASLVVDDMTTLSWVTENSASCTPSGGLGGWDATNITLPSGETSVVVDTDGEHTFTLTCSGVAGPVLSLKQWWQLLRIQIIVQLRHWPAIWVSGRTSGW